VSDQPPRNRIDRVARDYVPRHTGRTSAFRVWELVLAVGMTVLIPLALAGVVGSSGRPGHHEVAGDGDARVTTSTSTTAALDVPEIERPDRPTHAATVVTPPPSPPQVVDIPAIGVHSGLQALDLGADGTLQAPSDFNVAGWFASGTEPGQPGPAVIAGHVDSRDGPAVFYRLNELVVGDQIVVERQDGGIVTFRVTDVQRHPKDAFPADAVYGPVPGAELRLITCDGPFDRAVHSYRDNLVVFAVAADRPDLGGPAPGV
jgi:hypothetical protein